MMITASALKRRIYSRQTASAIKGIACVARFVSVRASERSNDVELDSVEELGRRREYTYLLLFKCKSKMLVVRENSEWLVLKRETEVFYREMRGE